MGSLCFSTVPILRCANFTRLQAILLVVPTAVEIVFSTSLIFMNLGKSRRHLWLTAEGWIYLSLALLEMLTHILPAVRDSEDTFKIFDRVLAATSFIPILFYILFIFLFASAELVSLLPSRLQTITKFLLLLCIPAIVGLSEVASFLGVSYRVIIIDSIPVLHIGFSNSKNENLWTFLTSFALALLTAYQAINFSLVFYRTVKVILDRRHIETASSDEAHFIRGTGWIAGGLKLGAVETVVGFAANGFGSAMTRRILRLLARGCLCIGLAKGLDSTEDFNHLRDELSGSRRKELRRSKLRMFISNPRMSTFRELTPTAAAFHSAPRAPENFGRRSSFEKFESGLPNMQQLTELKLSNSREFPERPPRERVTVHFDKGIPSLHLRFSTLSIPTVPLPVHSPSPLSGPPLIFKGDTTSRSVSLHAPSSKDSSLLSELKLSESEIEPRRDVFYTKNPQAHTTPKNLQRSVSSVYSTRSVPESYTSLSTVHEIVSQFPSLPSRPPMPTNQPPTDVTNEESWGHDASVKSQVDIKPKTPPPESPGSDDDPFRTTPRTTDPASTPGQLILGTRRPPSVPLSPTATPMTMLSGYMPTPGSPTSTGNTDNEYIDFGTALNTGKSRMFIRDSTGSTNPAEWIDYGSIPNSSRVLPPVIEEGDVQSTITATTTTTAAARIPMERSSRRKSSSVAGMPTVPFSKNPEVRQEEWQITRAVSRKPQIARIKTFGKAPMRSTPPVRAGHARNSLRIEQIVIPPKVNNNVEIVQGSLDSIYSRSSVLRDAEVLDIEYGRPF